MKNINLLNRTEREPIIRSPLVGHNIHTL